MKTYPHRTLPRKISTHRGPVAVAMPAPPHSPAPDSPAKPGPVRTRPATRCPVNFPRTASAETCPQTSAATAP